MTDKQPTLDEELEIMDEARRWIAEAKAARPPQNGSIAKEVVKRFPERYRWTDEDVLAYRKGLEEIANGEFEDIDDVLADMDRIASGDTGHDG